MGAFTSGKQDVKLKGGDLEINANGSVKKFVKQVQHLTFNGQQGLLNQQKIRYITERAVFRLTDEGLLLEAIAPGIDINKDILELMDFTPIISAGLVLLDRQFFE